MTRILPATLLVYYHDVLLSGADITRWQSLHVLLSFRRNFPRTRNRNSLSEKQVMPDSRYCHVCEDPVFPLFFEWDAFEVSPLSQID